MHLPPTDLSWFAENLSATVQDLIDAWNDSATVATSDEAPPDLLLNALQQLIEVLRLKEWQSDGSAETMAGAPDEPDVSELGDYGLNMLNELSAMAVELGLSSQLERLEQLALGLALWVVQQDGELDSIELVVNAVARLANQTMEQSELERIFFTIDEILGALGPSHMQDSMGSSSSTNQPWQLLLFNRAIIATRLESPQLMERAYNEIVERMPEQAPQFFREGMEQVRIQRYPDAVRKVIERYHQAWPSKRKLH